jgi:hypothetical protein
VVHLQGPLVFMGTAALAAAPGASVNPILHRAADRAAVGIHLFAALLAEGIEALAAQLLQRVALGVAQLYCCAEAFGYAAHQGIGASLAADDAVAGEHLAHHPLPRIRRATSCAGAGLRRPSSSISISGWSMGLMRMRSAMVLRRRW